MARVALACLEWCHFSWVLARGYFVLSLTLVLLVAAAKRSFIQFQKLLQLLREALLALLNLTSKTHQLTNQYSRRTEPPHNFRSQANSVPPPLRFFQ